jgi:cell division FtsZ-interacting protein ZapD
MAGNSLRDEYSAQGQLRRPSTTAIEEERRMSSTIEEVVNHWETLLEVEHDVARRDAEREELAREIEAQHERLHKVRATVLEELTKQRRVTLPRWPSGPKIDASLVDEDEWWSKMLGKNHKRAA